MKIKPLTDFATFNALDIRVGTIMKAQVFEGAHKPAFQLWINFGDSIGVKKSSAQITVHYKVEELEGTQVLAVVNFPPRQIGKFMSEVLVLGLYDENGSVILIQPQKPVQNGAQLG